MEIVPALPAGCNQKNHDDQQKRIAKTKGRHESIAPQGQRRARRLGESGTLVTATTAVDKQAVVNRVKIWNKRLRIRKTLAPQQLAKLKNDYQDAGLSDAEWEDFEMVFAGNVESILAQVAKKLFFNGLST